MAEWYELLDDDLWLKSDDIGEHEATTIYEALNLRPNSSALDIPCGAGRVSIHLAKMGVKITGIDLRSSFLERARNRFQNDGLTGEFLSMDMRKINFLNQYDGILNWQGSFGYFSHKENLEFLHLLSQALKVNGKIIVDQPHWQYEINHLVPEYSLDNITIRTEIDLKTNTRIQHRIVTGRNKDNVTSLKLYTYTEMETMFIQCGLIVCNSLGEYTGGEYTKNSKRLIMVGKKV
jgi:ubiquinone/menaquinone biosynthesis C-methylase UbiE